MPRGPLLADFVTLPDPDAAGLALASALRAALARRCRVLVLGAAAPDPAVTSWDLADRRAAWRRTAVVVCPRWDDAAARAVRDAGPHGAAPVVVDTPAARAFTEDLAVYVPPDAPAAAWVAAVARVLDHPTDWQRRAWEASVARERARRPYARPARDPRDPRPRVLLVADVRGWAFDVNLRAMAAYCPEFRCDHAYVVDLPAWPDPRGYDAVFLPYHRWDALDPLVPWDRALGSLRSSSFWTERALEPDPYGAEAAAVVNGYRGFHVVTRAAFDALRDRCPGVVYLTNPVDTRTFRAPPPQPRPLVASWSGNARHGNDAKGWVSVVQPACRMAGVPLAFAEYSAARVPHADMPAFYARGTVTLCASLYEGSSNSVMEAMAMGHAILATDVGNHREMRDSQRAHFGDSGIELLPRDAGAFAAALRRLTADPARVARMGAINAAEIRARWSWDAWRDRYAAFVRMALTDATG